MSDSTNVLSPGRTTSEAVVRDSIINKAGVREARWTRGTGGPAAALAPGASDRPKGLLMGLGGRGLSVRPRHPRRTFPLRLSTQVLAHQGKGRVIITQFASNLARLYGCVPHGSPNRHPTRSCWMRTCPPSRVRLQCPTSQPCARHD